MRYITVLGVDPGKVNAAYSVVRIQPSPFKYKVLEVGMFQHPLNDLTGWEVSGRMNAFKNEARRLKRKYKLDAIFAERFMTRGGSSMGTTIEVVSAMLVLLAHIGVRRVLYLTAAQWKNEWNKWNDLKAFYDEMKAEQGMPPHIVDATGIALYGASKELPDLEYFLPLDNIKAFKNQLKRASAGKDFHEVARSARKKKTRSAKTRGTSASQNTKQLGPKSRARNSVRNRTDPGRARTSRPGRKTS